MEDDLRIVKPYGILYTVMEAYYLLSPVPLPGDSWEGDNTYRFVCVPIQPEAIEAKGNATLTIYGYARHIITNAFAIEYKFDLPAITIRVLNEVDLTKIEFPIEEDKNDNEETRPF